MTKPDHARHPQLSPCIAALLAGGRIGLVGLYLLGGLGGLGGCGMSGSRIDRDIQSLVREQNERLREELREANIPNAGPDHATAKQLLKTPTTTNQTSSELSFQEASPDRDVQARLQQLLSQSGGYEGRPADMNGVYGENSQVQSPDVGRTLSLEDSLRASQETGREFLSAQEDYLLAAIRLLQSRHLWGPRLFNDTTLTFGASGDNGRFDPALNLVNSLRATRRLPFGGEVEARWLWNATENLRERTTGRYVQSSEIVLSGRVPLLRGAGSIAREDLIQAERDLVYQSRSFERFRRNYLVEIATDYFQLLETRAQIVNQMRQLDSLMKFGAATDARVNAGRKEAFQTDITANQINSAQSALADLREAYVLQLDRFKVRLGLDINDRLELSSDIFSLPEPAAELEPATNTALSLRLDLQNSADRLEDAKRTVANAKDGLLPDLDLRGEVGIPTDPDAREGGAFFDPDETRYSASATLSLPLDREQERLAVRSAQIRLERAQRDHLQLVDNIAVNVRSAVRGIDRARLQLNLAEQQVEINKRRLRAQQLQEDIVEPQQIVDTNNDLLNAENARDRARTRLRTAILQYLLETDQLRVTREGLLERLPGM